MLIYVCRVTGEVMLGGAHKQQAVLDGCGQPVEGLVQVQSQIVLRGGEPVNTIMDACNYRESCFSGVSEFKLYLKAYVQRVRTSLREAGASTADMDKFSAAAAQFVPFLLDSYQYLLCYTGQAGHIGGARAYAFMPRHHRHSGHSGYSGTGTSYTGSSECSDMSGEDPTACTTDAPTFMYIAAGLKPTPV